MNNGEIESNSTKFDSIEKTNDENNKNDINNNEKNWENIHLNETNLEVKNDNDSLENVNTLTNCSILLKTQIYDFDLNYSNFNDKFREYLANKRMLKSKLNLLEYCYKSEISKFLNLKSSYSKIEVFLNFLKIDYSNYSQFMNELCTLNTDKNNFKENLDNKTNNFSFYDYFSDLHLQGELKTNFNFNKNGPINNDVLKRKIIDEIDETSYKLSSELGANDNENENNNENLNEIENIDNIGIKEDLKNSPYYGNKFYSYSSNDSDEVINLKQEDYYNYFNDFYDSDDELSYSNEYDYNYHIINKNSYLDKGDKINKKDNFVQISMKKPDGMCVRINSNEEILSTCYSNGCIINYSLKERKYMNKIKASKDVITSIRLKTISNDKTIINSAGVDGYLKSYHVESGKFLSKVNVLSPILSMDRNENNYIFIGQDGLLRLIDDNINSIVMSFDEKEEQFNINRIASINNKENKILAGCNNGNVFLYDMRESKF